MGALRRVLDPWLDLLLPPRCGGCGALGAWFCERCAGALSPPPEAPGRRVHSLHRVVAVAQLEGGVERAVHALKYRGRRPLAIPLGDLLALRLGLDGLSAQIVVAVPLHPSRERQRGYNQAELLAARVRERMNMPAPPGRLVRVRATPAQVGQDAVRRRLNLAGAVEWRGEPGRRRPVILVDDVVTTGATLDACAAALRTAGFGRVTGLTLASTPL